MDGFDNYVDCGDSNVLSTKHITIALWLNPDYADGTQYILSRGQAQTENIDYSVMLWPDGKFEFVLSQNDSDPVSIISQDQIPRNE